MQAPFKLRTNIRPHYIADITRDKGAERPERDQFPARIRTDHRDTNLDLVDSSDEINNQNEYI